MEGVRVVAKTTLAFWQVGARSKPSLSLTPSGDGTSENRIQQAIQFLSQSLPEWLPIWLIRVMLAVGVLTIAWYGSNHLVGFFGRRVSRRFRRPSISRAILHSIRTGAMLVGVYVALGVLGVGLGNITLSVTVLVAGTGVVIAPILRGFIEGLFVLVDNQYEIGDMVELTETGQHGFVEDVTLRNTKIITLDNTFIVIPNENIRDRDVINYSGEDPRTWLSLDLLVTYESDITEARAVAERAAREVESVISEGPGIRIGSAQYPTAPVCFVDEFADDGVSITLHYWAKTPYKLLTVRSAVQEKIRAGFADANVEFAYPHTQVIFDDTASTSPV